VLIFARPSCGPFSPSTGRAQQDAKNKAQARYNEAREKLDSTLAKLEKLEKQIDGLLRQYKKLVDAINEAACSGTAPKQPSEPASD
jgi:predicted  nucleic acid-binding Zn-ribbon protein